MDNVTPITIVEKSNLEQVRTPAGSYYIGEFGGKARYIRYDLNAFAEMETLFGSMEAAQERLQSGSMKDIRTVLWLGLIWDEVVLDETTGDPLKYNISQYQVGSWLTTMNLQEVMNKLQAAISGSLPDGENDQTSAQNMTQAAAATSPEEVKN